MALAVILLAQQLTELLPLLLIGDSMAFGYYIPMRLFHVGVIPSIIILYFCNSRIDKALGLALVVSQFTWVVNEMLSFATENKWIVINNPTMDAALVVFALTLIILICAIPDCSHKRLNRLRILLSGYFAGKKDNN